MTAAKPNDPPPPPIKYDLFGAFLSYLVPGLGQMTQGRFGKGILFLVSLYALFFYGWVLGSKKNVYLPDYHSDERGITSRVASDLYARFQFVGQFPVGMAAWPAIYQYVVSVRGGNEGNPPPPPLGGLMSAPSMEELNNLQRNGDKTWDLGWVYTVIAGVLNVLVIYDALAGAAFREVRATPVPLTPLNGGPPK